VDILKKHGQGTAIRAATALLLAVSITVALSVDLPTEGQGFNEHVRLPDVALGQEVVYRGEIGLVTFYGGLLVLTPVFFGLVRGRLPTEISARGAKFAEDVGESIKETQALADDLHKRIEDAERRMTRDRLNIDQLAKTTGTTLED
jgi:hypothetical protein